MRRQQWLDRLKIETYRQKKRLIFLGMALLLGITLTLVSYPGIFYSDSYGRWKMAYELSRLNLVMLDDWLSVPPQLFMALCYKLTQNYASFTLLQSVLFFFMAFCAIDTFCSYGGLVAGILFTLCPVFYGFSVYIEMSVGCVIAMLWLLMLLLDYDHSAFSKWRWPKKMLYGVLCLFLYFCILGFRQNAFTILPVVAAILVIMARRIRTWLPAIIHTGAVVLSLVIIAVLPHLLSFGIINGGGSLYSGFVWEMVTVLGRVDSPEYEGMLDYLGEEEGATARAIEANSADSVNGYNTYLLHVNFGENTSRIRSDYLSLIASEPEAYFAVKGEFALRALGISQPLVNAEYNYDRGGTMVDYGFRDTARRQAFHASYMGFQEKVPLLRMPWVVFLIVLALYLCAFRLMEKRQAYNLLMLFLTGVFFYAAFLVNTQSHEFRYFFAPLVLWYIVAAASLGALAGRGIAWVKKRRAKRKKTIKHLEDKP